MLCCPPCSSSPELSILNTAGSVPYHFLWSPVYPLHMQIWKPCEGLVFLTWAYHWLGWALPGSADPSPASVRVLCAMPSSASLHHAWLTASPVSSRVCTCANRGWRIKLAYAKTVVIIILFCKKGCGNVSVHTGKPRELFLRAVPCYTNVFWDSWKIQCAKVGCS